MNRTEILCVINTLAKRNELYAKINRDINDGSESSKRALDILVAQNFRDAFDLIEFFGV